MTRLRRRTQKRRTWQRTGWVGRLPRNEARAPRLDPDLVAQAFADADAPRKGNDLPATGCCHDCGRPVGSDRRFCGPCLIKH